MKYEFFPLQITNTHLTLTVRADFEFRAKENTEWIVIFYKLPLLRTSFLVRDIIGGM